MKNLIIVSGLLFSFQLQAFYQGAVTRGTGGAGLAAIEASETPFANPAGMAFLEGSYFTGAFGANHGGDQDLAVALTENMRETLIPTAFSYVQSKDDTDLGEQLHRRFRLAVGKAFAKRMAWGIALHHEENKLNDVRETNTNATAGFLYAWNTNLGFAAMVEDVVSGKNAEQTLNLGASYSFRKFVRFKADLIQYLETSKGAQTGYALGIENYLNKWTILRFGAGRDGLLKANKYSAGFGFVLPRFAVHYAYQMAPDHKDLSSHSVDMAFPIW